MATYSLSSGAEKDAMDIWWHSFHKWSKDQADKYYNELFETINSLTRDPYLGRPQNHLFKGCLKYNYRSHYIMYEVVDDGIFVIRILHQCMNVEERMKGN